MEFTYVSDLANEIKARGSWRDQGDTNMMTRAIAAGHDHEGKTEDVTEMRWGH